MNTPEHFGEYGRPDFMINGEPASPEGILLQDMQRIEDLGSNLIQPVTARINKSYGYGTTEGNAGILLATTISEDDPAHNAVVELQLLDMETNQEKFSLKFDPADDKPKFYCPSRDELQDASYISRKLIGNSRVDAQVRIILKHLHPIIVDFGTKDRSNPAKLPAIYADTQSRRIAHMVRNIVNTEASSETHLKNYQRRLLGGNQLRLQQVQRFWVDDKSIEPISDFQIGYDDYSQSTPQYIYYHKTSETEKKLSITSSDHRTFHYAKPGKNAVQKGMRLIIEGLEEASGF